MDEMWMTPALREVRAKAEEVARTVAAPQAEEVDREARWPEHTMRALGDAGLLGLHVPERLGGLGRGYTALALATEVLGKACGSSGLVYGMHCVATKVIAAKATPYQEERYLEPIARGEHVTSLAVSEPGTGVHLYLPRTTFHREGTDFVLNGDKSFITSGGWADSYVASVVEAGSEMDPGTFSCMLIDKDAPGIEWQDPWQGFGMRGNSSRGMHLDGARVPADNLLGEEGDETWYIFEVVAPYFIVAMAGTYLGIAQAALERMIEHLKDRTYEHTRESIGAAPVLTHRVGEVWISVERTRQLLYYAARQADAGSEKARAALFACKADVADAVVRVANEAMTLTGGRAYGENSTLSRLLRDARASHVMSPTTDLLKTWLGRTLLDLPLL